MADILDRIAHSMEAGARAHAEALDGEIIATDDLLIAATGAPFAPFNVAFVRRRLADADRVIESAFAVFQERDLPCMITVRAGLDPAAERLLDSLDLASDTGDIMAATDLESIAPASDGIEIERVADAETLAICCDLQAAWSGMPAVVFRIAYPPSLLDRSYRFYLASIDAEPIATAGLSIDGSTACLFGVGTLEPFRRRGIGDAITRAAIGEARAAGCDLVYLRASAMGRPIYERMGFREITSYRYFLRRP